MLTSLLWGSSETRGRGREPGHPGKGWGGEPLPGLGVLVLKDTEGEIYCRTDGDEGQGSLGKTRADRGGIAEVGKEA